MGWFVALGVVVLLAALAWWSSGRAQPVGRRSGGPDDDRAVEQARSEVNLRDRGGWNRGP